MQIVQEFVLGTYDAEATAVLHSNSPNVSLQKDPRSQNAAQRFVPYPLFFAHKVCSAALSAFNNTNLNLYRYHAHVYTNGTICDLTNQPRETEVCSSLRKAIVLRENSCHFESHSVS